MTDAIPTETKADTAPPRQGPSENTVAARILLVLLVALVLWGVCIVIWGVPGLYIPAVALTAVVWGALIAITMGN